MKCIVKHITVLLITLHFAALTTAQIMGIKTFSISNDGISPKIFVVKKHSSGYFLTGSAIGLYRFDGANFIPYTFRDTPSSKAVTAIAEDRHHQVWVAFQSGEIGRLINGAIQLMDAEEGHPKVSISSIVENRDGTLFFSTLGEGIYYYLNRRFYNINTDDGLSDNYVYAIALNKSGIVAGTDRGINTINLVNGRKQIHSYTSSDGLPDNIVRCVAANSINSVPGKAESCWIGMQDKGVGRYAAGMGVGEGVNYLKNWNFGQVNSLFMQSHQLWVATEGNGIVILDNAQESFNSLTSLSSSAGNFIKTGNLLNDDEGNTWFTSNNLLVKTSGTQLLNIIPKTAGIYSQIHTLLCTGNGSIWVNYNSGLKEFKKVNNFWKETDHPLPVINRNIDVTCLYEDNFGHIWIGTMGKGVLILDPVSGRVRAVYEDKLLKDGSILSINGRNNQVWISSLGGAASCALNTGNADIQEPLAFQNFSKLSGIGSNYVYSIIVDRKDRVWFATDGKGITVDDHGKFTNYNENNGLKSKVIYNICEDTKGNIWFSALNAGVYKFDGKKFTNFSAAQGLTDTITSLGPDKNDNIIAVSKKGINIIEATTNNIFHIDNNQGIAELNEDLNCMTTANDGSLLLSSSEGIIRYNPSYVSLQPKIILDNVQLFLTDIDTATQKRFSYDENNVTFNFSAVSFSHASKTLYQYQLSGLSNEWVTTKDNNINFPKLPPGNYTFRVRSSVNNNFNNNPEATYSFVIIKPIWLQWWFISVCFLLIAASLYWYIKIREKRLQRIDRLEKERIQSQFETLKSQVNPHFLFNSFNTLMSVIEETPDKAVEYVEHLSDLYRKIVTYRDKDVISLREEVDLIDDYFFIQKKRFGNNLVLKNTLCHTDLVNYMIAPLTLQLLAENAVKHNAISVDAPLLIELYIEKKCLVVKNNLNPKSVVESGAGMGLQNIQKRYKLLSNDAVSIEKSNGWFCVKVPLLK